MQLANGQTVSDPRLDRIYQLDLRSLNYTVGQELLETAAPMYQPRSYTWSVDDWFDQGQEGACVGFAFAHDLVARPQTVEGVSNSYAREKIYWEAQKIDYWSGGAYPGASPRYEGTSVLAGAQVCTREGFFDSYYWALSLEEFARGIAYFGPSVIGVDWYTGMFNTDANGFIHPIGNIAGGHAILVSAIKIVYKAKVPWKTRTWQDVDWDSSYITLHNSWGKDWGQGGTAKLTLSAMGRLLQNYGDACFPSRTAKRTI